MGVKFRTPLEMVSYFSRALSTVCAPREKKSLRVAESFILIVIEVIDREDFFDHQDRDE